MTSMRGLFGAAGLVMLSPCAPDAAAADLQVIVSWTEVQHEVSPRPGKTWTVRKDVTVALKPNGDVSDTSRATSGSNVRSSTRGGRLREPIPFGEDQTALWTRERNVLLRQLDRAQHVETIRVTTRDHRTCTATVTYALKPGFGEYMLPHVSQSMPLYFSSIAAQQVTCAAEAI